jgi:hypothetical protein
VKPCQFSSSSEHIAAAAGGSFFALSIKEVHKLVEKMASNQSWDDERTPSHTRKVHQLEEVGMLTIKIDLLMKKLDDSGLDHLKMVIILIKASMLGGISPVSRSTTASRVVVGKTSTEVNHFTRKLFEIS